MRNGGNEEDPEQDPPPRYSLAVAWQDLAMA